MILIQNMFLSLDTDFSRPELIVADFLKCNREKIRFAKLYRKSVDARKNTQIRFCCSFVAELNDISLEKRIIAKNKNASFFSAHNYLWNREAAIKKRPVVVGFGPAGMFAALLLARSGLNPIVIERGEEADKRNESVKTFFNGGELNTESNVQFGEGGAGTFSDGKLNTGIKDIRCRAVLEAFVEFGAPEKILYEAKPHIGTDILINVVKNIRAEVIALGGEVRFSCRLDGIDFSDKVTSAILSNGEIINTDTIILATGHSARDTYRMLNEKSVQMVKKPFAIGVRIEHLQSDINKSLYGQFAEHPALGVADYKMAVHLENGRGVYTFCMCPGGEVINASSENGGIAVNGMSNSARDGKNANSALLVGVLPEDFADGDVLAGCELQRQIEKNAFAVACGKVPVTTVGHFLYGQENKFSKVLPTVKPETAFVELSEIFPEYITESLKEGIKLFDKKLKGFSDNSAVITAPESRSSAPVRILRGEDCQSVTVKGLYPCGEGAGYAGGIVSAAVDGLRCAEYVIQNSK